jgi:hypothetical protein
VACLAALPSASLAQQSNGVIGGAATTQFGPQYADYTIQIRNATTGQSVASKALDRDGKFTFTDLPLNRRYLVEIWQTTPNRLVCTEGPFALEYNKITQKTDVKVGCGKSPAIAWLLVASAGTAAAMGVTTASPSR